MVRHGVAPFLECSSKGDIRFSAFYARLRTFGGKSVEELYQAFKIFDNGQTGLSWRDAKGRKPVNIAECRAFYATLWDIYILENPHLLGVLKSASGLSDVFGNSNSACQASELWRIRNECLG